MNAQSVATVAVAVACIVSVGVASTTLESSLSSTPDDAIDFEWDQVPLNPEQGGALKRAITAPQEDGSESVSQEPSDGPLQKQGGGDGPDRQSRQSGESSDRQSAASADRQSSSGGTDQSNSVGGFGPIPDFKQSWLPLLIALLILALLVKYRDRVAAIFEPERTDAPGGRRGVPDPANDVERAWLAVVGASRLKNPWQRTPAECAAAAVENGLNADAVERIRRVFEEVRYGEREVTEARRDEVRRNLSRLDARTDGGGENRFETRVPDRDEGDR
jgi:hypothetical protein